MCTTNRLRSSQQASTRGGEIGGAQAGRLEHAVAAGLAAGTGADKSLAAADGGAGGVAVGWLEFSGAPSARSLPPALATSDFRRHDPRPQWTRDIAVCENARERILHAEREQPAQPPLETHEQGREETEGRLRERVRRTRRKRKRRRRKGREDRRGGRRVQRKRERRAAREGERPGDATSEDRARRSEERDPVTEITTVTEITAHSRLMSLLELMRAGDLPARAGWRRRCGWLRRLLVCRNGRGGRGGGGGGGGGGTAVAVEAAAADPSEAGAGAATPRFTRVEQPQGLGLPVYATLLVDCPARDGPVQGADVWPQYRDADGDVANEFLEPETATTAQLEEAKKAVAAAAKEAAPPHAADDPAREELSGRVERVDRHPRDETWGGSEGDGAAA